MLSLIRVYHSLESVFVLLLEYDEIGLFSLIPDGKVVLIVHDERVASNEVGHCVFQFWQVIVVRQLVLGVECIEEDEVLADKLEAVRVAMEHEPDSLDFMVLLPLSNRWYLKVKRLNQDSLVERDIGGSLYDQDGVLIQRCAGDVQLLQLLRLHDR